MTADRVPSIRWRTHLRRHPWRQGEHVSLIGPTGQGKTWTGIELLRVREEAGGHVCVLANKPRDETMDRLIRERGYRRVSSWREVKRSDERIVLWPPFRGPDDMDTQAETFRDALAEMFAAGAWCIYADEAAWLTGQLGLESWFTTIWQQGRSLGVSLLANMQRPRWVPLLALSAPTHLYLFRTNDADDLQRLAGLGVTDSAAVRRAVAHLPRYHALYVNTRDGVIAVTKSPSR